jgi:hypothetical protein
MRAEPFERVEKILQRMVDVMRVEDSALARGRGGELTDGELTESSAAH